MQDLPNSTNDTIPIVWSNDDLTVNTSRQLKEQLAFLKNIDIRGVFYVIPANPEGSTLDNDIEMCRLMESARSEGHEFYQHGYIHTPFESGVPETWMLDIAPLVRDQYNSDRLEIEAMHRLDAMVEMIEAGQKIWRRALGDDSPGYRPGWAAFCGNLYRALDILGYAWVSSRICGRKSWLWNQELWDQDPPYRETTPGAPWRLGRLIEYPIAGDYGFTVKNEPEAIRRMVDLFESEFLEFHRRGWQFNLLSHYHGLERNGGTGYEIHRQAIPKIQQSGKAEFMGMTELHTRTTATLSKNGDSTEPS
jgi:peptidoglycan/xylan/chitin deacetylase (PgdA/CDA1 family)